MNKNILLKYPSRERPDLFKQRANEWLGMSSGNNEIKMVVTADEDDVTMNNKDIKDFCNNMGIVINFHSDNTKISACNKDIPSEGWDYLLLISDDMECIRQNWDNIVCELFRNEDTETIWFDDGLNHSLCTFSVMKKQFYDRFGYVYNPEYKSVFCDNEFTSVSIRLGVMVKSGVSIVRHNWVGLSRKDALHQRNETGMHYKVDRDTFERRRSIHFGV